MAIIRASHYEGTGDINPAAEESAGYIGTGTATYVAGGKDTPTAGRYSGTSYLEDPIPSTMYWSGWIRVSTVATSNHNVLSIMGGYNIGASISMQTNGIIRLRGNAAIKQQDSTYRYPVNEWFGFEWEATQGGAQVLRIYNTAGALQETLSGSVGTSFSTLQEGSQTGGTLVADFDETRLSSTPIELFAPAAAPTQTAHINVNGTAVGHTLNIRVGGTVKTVTPRVAADVTPAGAYPMLVHSPDPLSTIWQSVDDRDWANGLFVYYPGAYGYNQVKWDASWANAVAAHPEGLHTVVSPKTVNTADLTTFCDNLPQSWRDKMVYAYYQEPEDNLTTLPQIEAYKVEVAKAGNIVRPYGIRNAVELQVWSLNPINTAYPSGETNLARFVDESAIDHISWSIYEKNTNDRNAEMVGRIVSFMGRFPSLTWDASATGIAVPAGTATNDPLRVTRANIVADLIARVRDAGATSFGWFDFGAWAGNLDYDTTNDPLLRGVLDAVNA